MDKNFNVKDVKWTLGWRDLPECHVDIEGVDFKIKTPGVTSIINDMIPDPEMEEWVRKIGKEKADDIMTKAGYRGTAMHLFIENFVDTLAKSKDPSEALRVTQTITPTILLNEEKIPEYKINEGRELFYKFYYSEFANNFTRLVKSELGIWSPKLFYRGKADVVYMDNIFGPAVTDYKTSNGFIKKGSVKELKYKYQLGGYANALDEMYAHTKKKFKRSSILCINTKTENLQEIVLSGSELEEYKGLFKGLASDWHFQHEQGYLIEN